MNIFPDEELSEYSHLIKNNYDFNKKLLFDKKDLMGYVALWSIRLSPLDIPKNLIKVLEEFNDHISPYFDNLESRDLGFIEMNLKDLIKFIKGNLITIKEFKQWNLSEMEHKMSISMEDNDRGDYCNQFMTALGDNDPLYDFVDLDAFIRNVAYSIYDIQ